MTDDARNRRALVPMFTVTTLIALAIRAAHILAISRPEINPHFLHPITDAAVHHRWALGLLDGSWPPAAPFFRAPLYPYLLGGLYALFGPENRLAVQLVHGLISAAGAGLAALCAARLGGRRAGWSAGFLFAVLWPSIHYSGELLIVTLSVTLNLLLLWLLLGGSGRARLGAAGLVLGLSAIARPTVLVVAPAIVWYLWRHRGLGARDGRWIALAIGLLLPILPVTAHNTLRGDDPVPIACSGGVNFYIGNNPVADGKVAFLPGLPFDWQGEGDDVVALAERESGRDLSPSGADRYFLAKGLKHLSGNPGHAIELMGRKLWLLVASGERSNNKDLDFWRARSIVLRWPVWPGWALVLALAALGLWRRDADRGGRLLTIGMAGLYAAALLLFFINARFRLPVMAWLVVPAGLGLDLLWTSLRTRRWSAGRLAPVVAVAVLLLSVVPDALTRHPDPETDYASWRTLGRSYLAIGDVERGRRALRKALDIDVRAPDESRDTSLGGVYRQLVGADRDGGDITSAERLSRAWVRRLPADGLARVNLAEILSRTGRLDEAVTAFGQALERGVDPLRARYGRGLALLDLGRPEPALADFTELKKLKSHPQFDFGLGLCNQRMGRLDPAERAFLAVLDAQPRHWQAMESLATVYYLAGEVAKEREILRRLIQVKPDQAAARRRLAEIS